MDPYIVLGVAHGASVEEAKKAFRRLASVHHPDKGGETSRFQEIQRAIAMIENGIVHDEPVREYRHEPRYAPSSSFTKPESAFEGYAAQWERDQRRQKYGHGPRAGKTSYGNGSRPVFHDPKIVQAYRPNQNVGEFNAHVSIMQAFEGYTCEVQAGGKTYQVKVPPGTPNGLKFSVEVEKGKSVVIVTKFMQSGFQSIHVDNAVHETTMISGQPSKVIRTKTLRTMVSIKNSDLKYGTTVDVVGIDGRTLKVAVPRDHNQLMPILVKGEGYYDWYPTFSQRGHERGDLLVSIHVTEDMLNTFI